MLKNTIKIKEQNHIKNHILHIDYLEVPSHIAEVAVRCVIQDYKNYLASLKAYSKNPASFKAKPKSPNYKDKDFGISYKLDISRMTKDGFLARVITKDNIKTFTSIKDKNNINKLYTSTDKKELLEQKFIDFYNTFSFEKPLEELLKDLKNRNSKINILQEIVELRFTPNKNHTLKGLPKVSIEAVIKNTVDLHENSKLNQILKGNEKFLEKNALEKVQYIQQYFAQDFKKSRIMGIDMGQINHTTLSFNYDHKKALVVSSRSYNQYIKNRNKELDQIKSQVFPKAIKDLQKKIELEKSAYEKKKQDFIENIKNKNLNVLNNNLEDIEVLIEQQLKEDFDKNNPYPKISKEDQALLNQSFVQLYCNEKYVKTLQKINHYKDNYLHK